MTKFQHCKVRTLLLVLAAMFIVSHPLQLTEAEAEVVEWVTRRLLGDLYQYNNRSGNNTISHETCQKESLTFLTGENQCVREKDLFRDCSHTVLASDSKLVAIANIDPNTLNITHLVLDNPNIAVEFHFNETGQALNNSFCHISRLEVFRGWNQTFQISHNGFSLGDDATVEINQAQLGYPLEDFEGELYCITISCTDPQLPRSGCLFFKVIGHQSNVTQAKFNCIVPGTLTNSSDECEVTYTTYPPTTGTTDTNFPLQTRTTIHTQSSTGVVSSELPKSSATTTVKEESTSSDPTDMSTSTIFEFMPSTHTTSDFMVGSTLFYVVVALSASITVALMAASVCVAVWCIGKRKRVVGSVHVTSVVGNTEESTGVESILLYESIDHPDRINIRDTSDSVSLSKCVRNPAYIHLSPGGEDDQPSTAVPQNRVGSSPIPISSPECAQNPAYISLVGSEVKPQQPVQTAPKELDVSGYNAATLLPVGCSTSNLISIRFHMGGETAVISIDSVAKTSPLYVNLDTINSSGRKSSQKSTAATVNYGNSDSLFISFTKSTKHFTCDTDKHAVSQILDSASIPCKAGQQTPHVHIDLQQHSSQAMLVSLSPAEAGQSSQVDQSASSGSLKVTSGPKGKFNQNPTYVNLDPEEV